MCEAAGLEWTHTHTHTHKPTTVTLAEHARRGLIMRQLAIIIVTQGKPCIYTTVVASARYQRPHVCQPCIYTTVVASARYQRPHVCQPCIYTTVVASARYQRPHVCQPCIYTTVVASARSLRPHVCRLAIGMGQIIMYSSSYTFLPCVISLCYDSYFLWSSKMKLRTPICVYCDANSIKL